MMQTDFYTQQTVLLDNTRDTSGEAQSAKLNDLQAATVSFATPLATNADLKLDIQSYLIQKPASTFFMRAADNDLVRFGVNKGDLLIVDRSLPPVNKSLVVVNLDGELLLKRILISKHTTYLTPWNNRSTLFKITPDYDFEIWGVVAYSIHKL